MTCNRISTSMPSAALVTRTCALIFTLLTFVQTSSASSMDAWRGRSIYQLIVDRFALTNGSTDTPCSTADMLYCGGTFQGLINQLDYIQGMGFGAVWVSPVVTNIEIEAGYVSGEAYHGYWSQDITTINSHLGTADDLKNLSDELHARDMYFMLDVVVNNMAYAGPGASVNYSMYSPFDSEEYFHPFCWITNYSDTNNSQYCWLGNDDLALPDLYTEKDEVRTIWQTWADEMIANYSIDGLRVDAAKHIEKDFWAPFQTSVDVYTVGEVDDAEAIWVCPWMTDALDGVLNYPMWYSMVGVISNSTVDMSGLDWQFSQMETYCQDTTLLGMFPDNQDVQRYGYNTQDMAQLKTMITYLFLSDGIPIIYYGGEHALNATGDPYNREALWLTGYNTSAPLYQHIKIVNTVRNAITNLSTFDYWSPYWTYKAKDILVKEDVLVVRKGYDRSIVSVITNRGSDAADIGPYEVGDTNFISGDTIVDVVSCTTKTVGDYGVIDVTVKNGLPQIWVATSSINTTDLCPDQVKSASSVSSSPAVALQLPSVLFLLTLIAFAVFLQ